jgi:hypothetical protein
MFLFWNWIPRVTRNNRYNLLSSRILTSTSVPLNRKPSPRYGIRDSLLTLCGRCMIILVFICLLLRILVCISQNVSSMMSRQGHCLFVENSITIDVRQYYRFQYLRYTPSLLYFFYSASQISWL